MFCEKYLVFLSIYIVYKVSGKIALTATPFDLDGFSDCRGIKDRPCPFTYITENYRDDREIQVL